MEEGNFSQLPVVTDAGDVQGVISWKSIGRCLSSGRACGVVSDCMDSDVKRIRIDDPLLDSVEVVATHDYVLVMGKSGELSGIITASDFTDQFNKLADPFLRIEEIEMLLRRLTEGRFTKGELREAVPDDQKPHVTSVHHLGLGDFCNLLYDEHCWRKLGLKVDRRKFVGCVRSVSNIRNKVMHFNPKGLSPGDTEKLREMGRFLGSLAS